MMKIARFEHVSASRFSADWQDTFGTKAPDVNALSLPRRATAGSAGYDFFCPLSITLAPGETAKIPTGIRAAMEEGWVLALFPRSSLGFKYRLQLNNTVGIVDSDYYHAKNEGHIFIKITNDSKEGKTVSLSPGDAFAQGIFLPFGITEDDAAEGVREGGFGSTGR